MAAHVDNDFQKISALLDSARTAAVSFHIHYSEAEDQWSVGIESSSVGENFSTESSDFNRVIENALIWLSFRGG